MLYATCHKSTEATGEPICEIIMPAEILLMKAYTLSKLEILMEQVEIFYPVIVLALWTFIIGSLIAYKRVKAASSKVCDADDYKYGESDNVPPAVCIPNRNYMNLLEMPNLFYVVSIILFITDTADNPIILNLAWLYVALRIIHSVIHLSYNKVMHRFPVFTLSNIVLLTIWILLSVALINGHSPEMNDLHARYFTFQSTPENRTAIEEMADNIYRHSTTLSGFVSASYFMSEDEKTYGSFSVWKSKKESESAGKSIREKIMPTLKGLVTAPPEILIMKVYQPTSNKNQEK